MTIPATTRVSPIYQGNASATSFAFAYKTYSRGEVSVIVSDGTTPQTLTLDVDYTVTLNTDQVATPGGTVTYPISGSPLPVGKTLVAISAVPSGQAVALPTGGAFNAQSVELGLDRLAVQIQQFGDTLAQAIRVPVGETTLTLPAASLRAGNLLSFDSQGRPTTVAPSAQSATALSIALALAGGSGLVGVGTQAYAANTVGGALFTTVWGDGATDKSAALLAANALGLPIRIIGTLVIGTTTTVTVPILDTMAQIFTPASLVTIANGQPVRPEWWGTGVGAMVKAIAALSSTGGVVQLSNRDYNIVGQYALPTAPGNGVGNQVKNVTLRGTGMPLKAADGTRFISGSGSVIQGTLVNYADNFRVESLGVDCGSYVVTTLNAGNYLDGFVPGTHQLQGVATDLTTYIKGVSFDRIRVLMATPVNGTATTYKHGSLVEHCIGPRCGYLEVDGGYHGIAFKSVNAKFDSVWVYNQQVGDAYIMKSDAYTLCSGLQVGILTIGREDATLVPPPGYLESTAGGYNTQNIEIGLLRGIKCSALMAPTGAAAPKTNISIGVVMGDQIAGDAIYFDANCSRFTIGTHTLSNITGGGAGIRTATSCAQVNIGNGSVTNAGGDGYALGGDVQHGKINAVNSGGWGVNRSTETVVDPNQISGSGNATGLISSAYVALNSSAFVNSWVDAGGSPAIFQAILVGRSVTLRGTIKNGTAGLVGTLPAGIRPSATLSFITVAVTSGGTRTFGHVDVGSDGTITVANYSTLAVNCTVAFNFSFSL
jgi:hypothetical protein